MRAYNDMVILKPREDLDRKWASDVIFAPDTALTGASSLGLGSDSAAVCEVVHIGAGSAECPDLSAVKVGDIAVLPLFGASKVLVLNGEPCLLTRFRGLAGVVTDLGTPQEALRALNDYVLTRQDREAFERVMYGGMRLTDDQAINGIPCDSGADGIVRIVLERVVSAGGGHWETDKAGAVKTDAKLWAPEQRAGELIGFNPLASCRFRRWGVNYRLVPYEDCQFAAE